MITVNETKAPPNNFHLSKAADRMTTHSDSPNDNLISSLQYGAKQCTMAMQLAQS